MLRAVSIKVASEVKYCLLRLTNKGVACIPETLPEIDIFIRLEETGETVASGRLLTESLLGNIAVGEFAGVLETHSVKWGGSEHGRRCWSF